MPKINNKTLISIVLLLLLLADVGYSFWQHQAKALDGDMAWNSIPDDDLIPVLENPFGTKAILEGDTYVNPNKFFCHWFNQFYLLHAPLWLQQWFSPIESVYMAMGIARTLIQIALVILLAMFISKSYRFWTIQGLTAMFLVVSLFQTNGYYRQMAIIDESTTYVFFYALPFVFLLIYILPFVRQTYWKRGGSIPILVKITWIPLAFVVCLSGPLNPGVALVFVLLVVLKYVIETGRNQLSETGRITIRRVISSVPSHFYFYLLPLVLLAIYSLYLGSYNSLSIQSKQPLGALYQKIAAGIYPIFLSTPAFLVLFSFIGLNLLLIGRKSSNLYSFRFVELFMWLLLFCVTYIVLLPFGGYRDYRPFVIRNDTLLPVTMMFIYYFGASTFYLVRELAKGKILYLLLVGGFIFFYTKMDNENFDKNECEKKALYKMAQSTEFAVNLNDNCAPLGWFLSRDLEESKLNAKLLKHWNITTKEVLYCNSCLPQ